MGLPPLTHLQFAILDVLGSHKKSGREVREGLKTLGIRKSGPAFYQLMARLEDAGFVKGWYDQKVIDGQIIKERRYRVLGAGVKAWEHTRDFYVEAGARSLAAKGRLVC
ncbi:MAG: hypothetical protein JSU86_05975 [Phycisphaerales bacterium]|nr:MAG: hypothetical protein JSU86_05975 [Phycisphaerales bacterium]